MAEILIPHRVTFVAPQLSLAQQQAHLAPVCGLLLFVTLFEHLCRHPSVTVTDPDDFRLTDDEERLVHIEHPDFDRVRSSQFGDNRRDELLSFELQLDPAKPLTAKLRAERFDGKVEEFAGIGAQGSLSQLIASCLQQWLQARGQPLTPRALEQFGVPEFLNASACLYQAAASRDQQGGVNITVPPVLRVPFFRTIYVMLNHYTYREILQMEPDNPWAIRDMFIDGLHNKGPESRDPIRRAIQTAPMFGKLYLSMFGKDVSDDENLQSFAMATVLIPHNGFAPKDYAYALDQAGRWEEAYRYAERAVRVTPLLLASHMVSMNVINTARYGERLIDADHHVSFVDDMVERKVLEPNDTEVRVIRCKLTDALSRVGRLAEAIQFRSQLLEGLAETWPKMTKELHEWQTDAPFIANRYAREAHYRGDPGRVLEGYAIGRPDSWPDLAFLIDALVATGREDLAMLAFAQHAGRPLTNNPISRTAGARACILGGRLTDAVEHIVYCTLRYPQLRYDTAINRLLRLAAARPAKEWEPILAQKLGMGARRVAKIVARDCADFVPGAAQIQGLAQALQFGQPGAQPVQFDPTWFASLKKSLEQFDVAPIDNFFGHFVKEDLAMADAMATSWVDVIPPEPKNENESPAPRAAATSR
jgi:hypothetical protein